MLSTLLMRPPVVKVNVVVIIIESAATLLKGDTLRTVRSG